MKTEILQPKQVVEVKFAISHPWFYFSVVNVLHQNVLFHAKKRSGKCELFKNNMYCIIEAACRLFISNSISSFVALPRIFKYSFLDKEGNNLILYILGQSGEEAGLRKH